MPLHYVDPHKKGGRWYKAYVRVSRTRPGLFYWLHIGSRIDAWLYRATRGRYYPRILGTIATAPLMTTGAKSGQPRETQLTYFHDGPDPILIASYGGGPKNPQWYYNLRAHPECQFGDEKFVATEVTDPDEHTRLYGLAEQVYAGYVDQRVKAATVGRQIPVFRLKPCQGGTHQIPRGSPSWSQLRSSLGIATLAHAAQISQW
jgi:deazaflavin-dependent oxidoreductase (nitroreductase family)